jgi:hypothetical protein
MAKARKTSPRGWRQRGRRWRQALRPWWGTLLVLLFALLVHAWLTRPEPPPSDASDLCAVFEEKPHWYRSSRDAAKKWGMPEAVQMAVIHQESSFQARIRPPRRWILWIIPGPRPSTAYGYTQALDATWRQFQRQTDRGAARRDDFDDAAHFVSWYGREIERAAGVPRDDAYRVYLAYHEGPGGFLRGSHQSKAWLLGVARKVEARAQRYQRQLDGCRDRLERPGWWLWFLGLLLFLALWAAVRWWWRRGRPPKGRRRRRQKRPRR